MTSPSTRSQLTPLGPVRTLKAFSVVTLMLSLAACSALPSGPDAGSSTGASVLSTSYAEALPVEQQLMLGTMALDETSQTVTSEQARELGTLWGAYRSLLGDSNTSEAELQALLRQIEGTMTESQLQAIAALELTAEDRPEILQGLGLGLGRAAAEGEAGEDAGGFRSGDFGPPEGFEPPGDFEPPEDFNPGGGGGESGLPGGGEGGGFANRGQGFDPE